MIYLRSINKTSAINRFKYFILLLPLAFVLSCVTSKQKSSAVTPVAIPYKEQVGALNLPENIEPVKAPFPMPNFRKPVFPAFAISITERGAKPGAKVTAEIQATIDEVSKHGGGTAIIPKGKWNTGRISLKSNVNLKIEEGYRQVEVSDIQRDPFGQRC